MVDFFAVPVCQWPVDDAGQPKTKHFIVPAWFVGIAKKDESAKNVNMVVQWKTVDVCDIIIHVPVLVNSRAIKKGEVLKRQHVEEAPFPACKKTRR